MDSMEKDFILPTQMQQELALAEKVSLYKKSHLKEMASNTI
jgi:hypothetical protein